MKNVQTIFSDGTSRVVNLHQTPDTCPFCHHAIDPNIHMAYCDQSKWNQNNCLQVIYRCTKNDCRNLFIAYYEAGSSTCATFTYKNSRPMNKKGRTFTDTVLNISPSLCTIYNQSLSAEQDGLTEICGVGYRKSLEFLIKDYLIQKLPDQEEAIKNKFLGDCIKDGIENDNIKNMAKRAVWLGNDETHYLKKWVDKDLEDLKKLIDATIYWIEMEKLAEDTQQDMPE
ncbi:MAG: hypothetical protein WCS88_03480 [Patescibacteria group bacterium]|jgi:hypothetical protein